MKPLLTIELSAAVTTITYPQVFVVGSVWSDHVPLSATGVLLPTVFTGITVGLAGRRRVDPVACLAVSGAACLLEQATRRTGTLHDHAHSDQEVSLP